MTEAGEREAQTDAAAIACSLRDQRHSWSCSSGISRRFIAICAMRVGAADADDLAAQVFEVAFRRRADYRRERADARPWLFGIATRLASEHRRRQRRGIAALGRLFARDAERPAATDERVDGSSELRAALASVRAEDRDLLFLHACLELTYEECAVALALPVGTVRSRLHRARARLRRELESGLRIGEARG